MGAAVNFVLEKVEVISSTCSVTVSIDVADHSSCFLMLLIIMSTTRLYISVQHFFIGSEADVTSYMSSLPLRRLCVFAVLEERTRIGRPFDTYQEFSVIFFSTFFIQPSDPLFT